MKTPAQPHPPIPAEVREAPPTTGRVVRLVSSRGALWVAAAWGLAEASLFFIVPDVWLGFVALYAPRRVIVMLLAIVAGAMVGAALLFLATQTAGEDIGRLLSGLPGITQADLGQTRAELAAQGVAAFLNGPLQGLPVKLYVHAAALDGLGLPSVLVGVALNRVERIGLTGVVMAVIGVVARPVIRRWPRMVVLTYGVAWTIFYSVFWATRST